MSAAVDVRKDWATASGGTVRQWWGQLLHSVPSARGRLALATLLAFCANAAAVALLGVSAWLLSRAAEHPPVLYLQVAAVGVRFFGISRGAFRYTERLVGHDLALRLQSALRIETYTRLARTTLLGRRRGDLLSRIIADVSAIEDLVVRVWLPFASASLVLVATTTIVGVFSASSAAVLLLTCVAAGLVVPWLARRASGQADARAASVRGHLADAVHEVKRCAADLVAYGLAEDYLDRIRGVDAELRAIEAKSSWVRGVATAFVVTAAGVAVIGALIIGSSEVAAGTLPPVMLAVLVLTPLSLHETMNNLTQSAQSYTRAKAALLRVHGVLTAEPVGCGDVPLPAGTAIEPSLRLTDLAVGWPRHDVLLSGLTLHVGPGEKVALTGASGVGKTTVAATILGLIPAKAGTVEVQGRLGYLAQDAHIFATTVAENVMIGNRDATRDDIIRALRRAGLDWDPDRIVGELGTEISGGEARRVALARLLVGDYQVLILDEPSEHLDSETARILLDDMWATMPDNPMLVITHDPDVIARCDRVIQLDCPL